MDLAQEGRKTDSEGFIVSMFHVKATSVAVLAAAALGVLVLPGQAQAASGVSVQICNKGSRALSAVKVDGVRADGSSQSGWASVVSNNCTSSGAFGGLKSGQTLDITLDWTNYDANTYEKCSINGSDGAKLVCSYNY